MYAVVICMLFLSGSKINKSIRYMFDVISFFVFMLSFIVFTLLMRETNLNFFLAYYYYYGIGFYLVGIKEDGLDTKRM